MLGHRLLGLQADVYRDMWERAMDGALEKLLQMSSDGSYFVGSVQVPKSHKGKTVFVRKVRPSRYPPVLLRGTCPSQSASEWDETPLTA